MSFRNEGITSLMAAILLGTDGPYKWLGDVSSGDRGSISLISSFLGVESFFTTSIGDLERSEG